MEHDQNCDAVLGAGFHNTFAATLPVHSHVARPSTEEEQIAALVKAGSITTSSLWHVVGAAPCNSDVALKAQAKPLANSAEFT